MATDATGSPTPLGIPKFNTSADAPSGLGFNAAMDSIDSLLAARVTKPASIISGEFPIWNGTTWVRSSALTVSGAFPGQELAYGEFTSSVTSSATTEGGAIQVATSGAITYDGSPVVVEFFAPSVTHTAAGTNVYFDLFDSGSALGFMSRFGVPANGVPVYLRRRFTPSAISHTYKVNVFTDSGTASVNAGPGGASQLMPGFIRITRA